MLRGRSSVGRAPQSHCGGRGFDSLRLHQNDQKVPGCRGIGTAADLSSADRQFESFRGHHHAKPPFGLRETLPDPVATCFQRLNGSRADRFSLGALNGSAFFLPIRPAIYACKTPVCPHFDRSPHRCRGCLADPRQYFRNIHLSAASGLPITWRKDLSMTWSGRRRQRDRCSAHCRRRPQRDRSPLPDRHSESRRSPPPGT